MCMPTCAAPATRKASSASWTGPSSRTIVELIAWIATQDWCNGKVGGIGQSYYAIAQWQMATYNPPGLACIIPYDGLVDQYRCSNYHGGIFCSYRPGWYISLLANNQHRAAGGEGRPRMQTDLVGDIIEHTPNDDWWKERSPFERLGDIKVPVLSIGHWGKMGLHLRGNILGYEQAGGPKKLVVTGARNVHQAHHMFDQIEFHEKEMLPFYEHHLKGVDNGVMDERAGAHLRAQHRRSSAKNRNGRCRARNMCRSTCAKAVGEP